MIQKMRFPADGLLLAAGLFLTGCNDEKPAAPAANASAPAPGTPAGPEAIPFEMTYAPLEGRATKPAAETALTPTPAPAPPQEKIEINPSPEPAAAYALLPHQEIDYPLDRSSILPPNTPADATFVVADPYLLAKGGQPTIRSFVIPALTLPEVVTKVKLVKAIQLLDVPQNVVRHAQIRIDSTNSSQELDAESQEPGFANQPFLTGLRDPDEMFAIWTPQHPVATPPANAFWRLYPDADLVITLFLEPGAEDVNLQPKLALWFAEDKVPTQQLLTVRLANETLRIEPGATQTAIRDIFVVPTDCKLAGLYPNANKMGKSFQVTITGPKGGADGRKAVFQIPDWKPALGAMYRFAKPVDLVAGTRLEMEVVYRELPTAAPALPIAWGPRVSDEIGEVWVQLITEGQKPIMAERAALTLSQAASYHELALTIEAAEFRVKDDHKDLQAPPELAAKYAHLHAELGFLYADFGEIDTAESHAKRAVALAPESAEAHASLGAVQVRMGFYFDAQKSLEKALKLWPDDPQTWYNLGAVHFHYQHSMEKALECYEKALELSPDDVRYMNNLATTYVAMKRWDDAAILLDRSLQINPRNPVAITNLGRVCEGVKDFEKAGILYRRALFLAPDMMGDALPPLIENLEKQAVAVNQPKPAPSAPPAP